MSDSTTTPEPRTTAEAGWQPRGDVRLFWAGDERLEATLDELAAMSAAEPPRADFLPTFLQVAATAVNASAAALWIAEPGKDLTLQRQLQRGTDTGSVEARGISVEFSKLSSQVEEAHSTGQAGTVHRADGSVDALVFLCPWRVNLGTGGVVGIAIPEDVSADARQSAQQFTHAIAAIAADYFRNVRLHELSAEQGVWREFEEFTLALHTSNDADRVASAIVNEGRRLTGADRLSLALAERGNFRLLAVSGVTMINRRGNLARRMEELSRAVAAGGEVVWRPNDAALPPQVEEPLDRYLEEAHARTIAVTPLVSRPKPIGRRPRDGVGGAGGCVDRGVV